MGAIGLDDLSWTNRPHRPWAAYGQSKLANLLFTFELQRRLERDHSPVRAFAAHPGFAATNLSTHYESKLTTQRLWDVSEQLTAVGYPALVG